MKTTALSLFIELLRTLTTSGSALTETELSPAGLSGWAYRSLESRWQLTQPPGRPTRPWSTADCSGGGPYAQRATLLPGNPFQIKVDPSIQPRAAISSISNM